VAYWAAGLQCGRWPDAFPVPDEPVIGTLVDAPEPPMLAAQTCMYMSVAPIVTVAELTL
jgi:hypothetical protein